MYNKYDFLQDNGCLNEDERERFQKVSKEMIDFCAPFEVEGGRASTLEEAKGMLREYFPTLERWRV